MYDLSVRQVDSRHVIHFEYKSISFWTGRPLDFVIASLRLWVWTKPRCRGRWSVMFKKRYRWTSAVQNSSWAHASQSTIATVHLLEYFTHPKYRIGSRFRSRIRMTPRNESQYATHPQGWSFSFELRMYVEGVCVWSVPTGWRSPFRWVLLRSLAPLQPRFEKLVTSSSTWSTRSYSRPLSAASFFFAC